MSAEAVHFEAQPIDCETLRATEFPWTAETTYLNHASIGPLPERTRLALDAFNRRRSMPFNLPDRDLFALMTTSRRLISDLLSVSPEEIGLSVNTGYGLSVIARALPLERGDRVLVSDKEFPANVYPWMRLGELGIEMELVPTTPDGWPDEPRLLERLSDPASPRARDLTRPIQQRLPGGSERAIGGDSANRCLSRRRWDPGRGPGSPRPQSRRGGCACLRWPEMAAVALGIRLHIRAPRADFPAQSAGDRVDGVRGNRRFHSADQLPRHPSGRRATVRVDYAPYQDFAGMNASLGLIHELGVHRIAEHLRALHAPILDWADRTGVRVSSPRGPRGSGIVCVAPERVDLAYRALKARG